MPVRSSHLAGGVPPASRGPTIANRECAPCLILSAAECGTRGYTAAYISMSDTRYTFTPAGCSHNGTKIDPDTHYRFALRSPRPLALLAARYSTNYHLKSCTRVKYSTQRADIESMLSSSVHHSPSQMVPSSVCHAIVCLCLPHPQHSPPLHAPTPPSPHGGPQHSEAVWIFS